VGPHTADDDYNNKIYLKIVTLTLPSSPILLKVWAHLSKCPKPVTIVYNNIS